MWQPFKHPLIAAVILLIVCSISSCKISAPTLKSLDKVKVERNGSTGYTVGTEAVIHNPNRGKIVVKGLYLDVEMGGKTLASIGKKDDIVIKRNADFSIPLLIEIKSVESIFSDFKSVFGMLKDKDVELSLKGNLKIKAFCILRRSFPINYKQKVKLPQFK